jgi:hypothetical protein
MADVRGQGIDLAPIGIESDGEILVVAEREVAVEAPLEVCGPFLQTVGVALEFAHAVRGKPGSEPSRKEIDSHESFQH